MQKKEQMHNQMPAFGASCPKGRGAVRLELARLLMERTGADMIEAAMLVSIAAQARISAMGGSKPRHVRVAMARGMLGM